MRKIRSALKKLLGHHLATSVQEPIPLTERQLVLGLGAMKSGTTWLSDYLMTHPDFFHSPIKEMNVFSSFFPENSRYPGYVYQPGDSYRLMRMERAVLSFGGDPRRVDRTDAARGRFDRLYALAQLGHIASNEQYLTYFEGRIGDQMHFGEISPSYAHLPPQAYQSMAGLTRDVRFLFLMRDPTERAASHLRHARRRIDKDEELNSLVKRVTPDSAFFIRSDYRYTLDTLRALGLEDKTRFLVYENLFCQETVDELCDWLGIGRCPAILDKRLNPGVGAALNAAQMDLLRDRLAPIYDGLRHDPALQSAASWRW